MPGLGDLWGDPPDEDRPGLEERALDELAGEFAEQIRECQDAFMRGPVKRWGWDLSVEAVSDERDLRGSVSGDYYAGYSGYGSLDLNVDAPKPGKVVQVGRGRYQVVGRDVYAQVSALFEIDHYNDIMWEVGSKKGKGARGCAAALEKEFIEKAMKLVRKGDLVPVV